MSDVQSHFQRYVLNKVRAGIEGKNQWLPVYIPSVRKYFGIGKQIYTLIGGDPGSGKSSFTHLLYVIGAYQEWKKRKDRGETDIDLKIYIRSMERPTDFLMGKWTCLLLMLKYKILIDVPTLYTFGSKKSAVSGEIYELIKSCQKYVDRMMETVTIIPGAENPTGIYKHMIEVARMQGTFTDRTTDTKKRILTGYKPNHPYRITLYVLDHIGKLMQERDMNKKANIDKMGEYLTFARDMLEFSPVVVSQFNRNLAESGRRKSDFLFTPESSDFKDSGSMYEDADVALTLFSPQRYHVKDYEGYQVQRFNALEGHNQLRIGSILKNSYGPDNIHFGLQFVGENGYYRPLPSPKELDEAGYKKFVSLDGLIERRIKPIYD